MARTTKIAMLAAATVFLLGALLVPAHASAASAPLEPAGGMALSWGYNFRAQLGLGGTCSGTTGTCVVPSPTYVLGSSSPRLFPASAVAAGAMHSLAILPGGRVQAWGWNDQGQVGDGSTASEVSRPVPVVGPGGSGQLTGVTAIGAGNAHSLAVGRGGQVWTWGLNLFGALGVGTDNGPSHCPVNELPGPANVCSRVPVGVVGPDGTGRLTGVTAVAGGINFSVALRSDGTVWTWGINQLGQLGTGTGLGMDACKPYTDILAVSCSLKPVQVVGPGGSGHLSDIVAIAAGSQSVEAVRADGTVWAWGGNRWGTLGQPDNSGLNQCPDPFTASLIPCSRTPVEVMGPDGTTPLTGITAISADGSTVGLHVIALRDDGTVWGWGVDDMGQLGNGATATIEPLPVQVEGPGGVGHLTDVVDIAAGGKFSLAVRADGTLWSWGINETGQLGLGTDVGPAVCTTSLTPCSRIPRQVVGPGGTGVLSAVTAVAAGQVHSLALQRQSALTH